MPVYRVFVNDKDTGEYVTASNPVDAYADVAASMPLKYDDHVHLKEIESPDARPGFPIGNNTIQSSTRSTLSQELYIKKPN